MFCSSCPVVQNTPAVATFVCLIIFVGSTATRSRTCTSHLGSRSCLRAPGVGTVCHSPVATAPVCHDTMVCGPMFGGLSTHVGVSGNTAWNGTCANLSGGTILRAAFSPQCAPSLKSVGLWHPQTCTGPSIMAPTGGHPHRTPKRPQKGHFRPPQHPKQSAAYDCQVGPLIQP